MSAATEPLDLGPQQPLLFDAPEIGHKSPKKVAAIVGHEPLLFSNQKPTRKVAAKSDRKCPFPALKDIAWEFKSDKGCWQCWHVPDWTSDRAKKTYLGNFCGQKLADYLNLSRSDRRDFAANWVAEKRAKKAAIIQQRGGN